MTIKSLYPASRPALGIDFAKTKRLDPRVTFTRASTATYVDNGGIVRTAASGVARFDHNPTTGESLGLLVEEARTNSLTYSEQLQQYSAANVTVTSDVSSTAPGGQLNASKIIPSSTNNAKSLGRAVSFTAATTHVVSFFAKPAGYNFLVIALYVVNNGGDGPSCVLDLVNRTLTVSNSTAGYSFAIVRSEPMQNGWTRFALSFSNNVDIGPELRFCPAPNGTPSIQTSTGSDHGRPTFAGDGTSGVLLWGLQSETGAFPTSYIPTTGATVTRAADVATLSNANSSIFPTSAFTVVNTPFGTAGGGSTVKLVGPTIKRTAIYDGDLPQAQINALAGVNDNFWRWRVLGDSFALPNFTTDGSVTVDWGDGTVQTLTTAVRTFANGGGYHDIGFRLNSGTFFRPNINDNATYKNRVIALGPAPASMKINADQSFRGCSQLRQVDGYGDYSATTGFFDAWSFCSSLVSFPLINTSSATSFSNAWINCSNLTSFPLLNTALVANFNSTWGGCSGLTSFPLLNTGAGTTFSQTWRDCSSLTSFPLINVSSATGLGDTWLRCSGLTSFPLINTSSLTSVSGAWKGCSGLTSFPLINTASTTNFQGAWESCSSLTSFPALNFSSAVTFANTWLSCGNLSSFPANMFNTTGTLVSTAFNIAFQGCALTAASIENILTSLVTNGQSNITLGLNGGTNAGAATWTTAANTAYATLITRGWTITRNA
jgi:hypothetical protein